MLHQNNRMLLGVGMAALLLITAGCMGLATGDPDPETIAENIQERHDKIDSVEGVQISEYEGTDQTMRTTTELIEIPGVGTKRTVTDAGSGALIAEGHTTVSKEGITRTYDPAENTITRYEFDGSTSNATSGIAGGSVTPDRIEQFLNRSNVTYNGTDTVADRAVHVISIDQVHGSNVTAYIDQEYWYPLRYEMTYESPNGDTSTSVMYFEEVEFNGDVSKQDLTLDAPADATVSEYSSQTFDSAEAVQSAAPFEIVEPDLPEEYTFETASTYGTTENATYSLQYTDGDSTVYYTASSRAGVELTGDEVSLGNTTGYLSESSEINSVRWETDNGVRYSMSGLERDQLLTAAKSTVPE